MSKLILATASALVLASGGAAVSLAAGNSYMTPNAGSNMPAASGTSGYSQTAVNPSRDEIRQAQQQLQNQGLYDGQIDGIVGPQTKQALQQFQSQMGLPVTATLDQSTMNRLLGMSGGGQGSSMPASPTTQSTGSTPSPQPATPGAGGMGQPGSMKR
jgi:peptidoglycan hydrolase-like protein with peptidoglycan-binding domain